MKFLSLLFTLFIINSAAAKTPDFEHIRVNTDIELIKINENYYVHTSWFDFPGYGRFPSNGLIFVKNGKALLIDTPNTNEQTLILYNFLQDHLKADITKIIVGHSHSDCMGGLSVLHDKGAESIAYAKTVQICTSLKLPIPEKSFSDSMTLEFEGETVICRYFGAGHTVDNSIVYFPKSKIFFGGCLIKSLDSKGLGNTNEAVIDDWDRTVLRIKKAYPSIKLVIPGHRAFGDLSLLNHTMTLVKDYKQKAK
ncbi:MAG: subclass B1 metallo-beta-lactamase [Desulfobacterales bacterium]|nr:subclass B1 metallo-beta-lactamase [Desulfobacterales bacterium]